MSAKLRHIALTVPDPEKAAEFYMRAFGLKRVGETRIFKKSEEGFRGQIGAWPRSCEPCVP